MNIKSIRPTAEQAKDSALRFINSYFGISKSVKVCIPAQSTDDDIILLDYINQSAKMISGLELAVDKFRDSVLHQRHSLEGNGMTSEQINDVLSLFDRYFSRSVEDDPQRIANCPFCGGKASLRNSTVKLDDVNEYPCVKIMCNFCSVATTWFTDKNDALNAWNARMSAENKELPLAYRERISGGENESV